MKKLHFGILLFSFLIVACSNGSGEEINSDQKNSATVISVTPSVDIKALPSDAGEFTISVTADGDWSISTDDDWISHFPSGGVKNKETEVKIRITKNTDFEGRQGYLTIKSGNKTERVEIFQSASEQIVISNDNLMCGAAESVFKINVKSNSAWTATCDANWCSVSPAKGSSGETEVSVKVSANSGSSERSANVTFTAGNVTVPAVVTQYSDNIETPEGYTLVWHDEFNEGTTLSSDWTYEVQSSGWVNNELQNYVKNPVDGKYTVEVNNGILNINCFKGSDGKVYSGRVYAKARTGWTYGYFEARINLPSGKGTWPAFWMMPVDFKGWPDSGEMDIMEEVGVVPNEVSSSLHALGHYHVNNTQVTKARKLDGAEGNFHVYAMEWTPDVITTYVDGAPLLTYTNDGSGDINWPYHNPFYVILNLAWGGDWGGMNGVNEAALPVTLKVDYVRVFQKK